MPNELEAHALLRSLHYGPSERENLSGALASTTGVSTVAVTLGAGGVLVHGPDHRKHHEAPHIGHVVDTTGASDAFTATFIHQLAQGRALAEAVDHAQASASLSLRAFGGYVSMPGTGASGAP